MNDSCTPAVSHVYEVTSHILSAVSVPIYGTAIFILTFRCPTTLGGVYRNLLLQHIILCIVMELHVNAVWQLVVQIPQMSMCSFGIGGRISVIMFISLVILIVFVAISGYRLLDYRMKVVTTIEQSRMKYYNSLLMYISYFMCLMSSLTLFFAYPGMVNQTEYKQSIEKKFDEFPSFLWCDSCFFINIDLQSMKIFAFTAMFTAIVGSIYCIVTTVTSMIGLQSIEYTMSRKTIQIQRNFLWSLMYMTTVHVTFIAAPVVIYLLAHFIVIKEMWVSYSLSILLSQHGSGSTFVLLTTNTAITQIIRKICKRNWESLKKFICRSPPNQTVSKVSDLPSRRTTSVA